LGRAPGGQHDAVTEFPSVPGVEHRFVQAGDVRLHVAEAGAGDPVVLVHGWPQHWYCWRHVVPRLANDHRVVCPDLRERRPRQREQELRNGAPRSPPDRGTSSTG
jgi:hypothetical protein